jgi:hypothetical protein
VLLERKLLKPWKLRQRIGQLPEDQADPDRRTRLEQWLKHTLEELGAASD